MKTLHVKELKRDVSLLGLGSDWFSRQLKDQVFEVLDEYRSVGGNLIDAAEVYGGGDSERTIGEWLAARGARADVIVLDKGCHYPPHELSPAAISTSVTRCLEKLGTGYLDLWAFHRDKPEEPVGPLVETLNEEVAKGRIRGFGASNWAPARIAEANEYAAKRGLMGMAFSSPNVALATPREPYWAGCTHAAEADIAWYAGVGLPLIAWSAQARGFFLGNSGPENTSDEDLTRVYHSRENFEKLRRARELAKTKGVTAIQIALAYVLNLPASVIALIGPHRLSELESSVAATEIALSPAEMDWLALKTATL